MDIADRAVCGTAEGYRKIFTQRRRDEKQVNRVTTKITQSYTRKNSTYSKITGRINSSNSDFGEFTRKTVASFRKKFNYKDKDNERVQIDDDDIDDIIKNVFNRQSDDALLLKQRSDQKSFNEVLNSTRDSRSLDRYNRALKGWKESSQKISDKLKRPMQNIVFNRCDSYRRRKEIFNLIENNQRNEGVRNSAYSFKLSLRTPEKITRKTSKAKSSCESPMNQNYGDDSSRNKTLSSQINKSVAFITDKKLIDVASPAHKMANRNRN